MFGLFPISPRVEPPAPAATPGDASLTAAAATVLKHMFDFYDQVTATRQYPSIEQTNR